MTVDVIVKESLGDLICVDTLLTVTLLWRVQV